MSRPECGDMKPELEDLRQPQKGDQTDLMCVCCTVGKPFCFSAGVLANRRWVIALVPTESNVCSHKEVSYYLEILFLSWTIGSQLHNSKKADMCMLGDQPICMYSRFGKDLRFRIRQLYIIL